MLICEKKKKSKNALLFLLVLIASGSTREVRYVVYARTDMQDHLEKAPVLS